MTLEAQTIRLGRLRQTESEDVLVVGVKAPHQNVFERIQALRRARKRDGIAFHHRFQFSIFGKCLLHQERAVAVLGENVRFYGFGGGWHDAELSHREGEVNRLSPSRAAASPSAAARSIHPPERTSPARAPTA